MKRAAACILALALLAGMCVPLVTRAQSTAWTVSLTELTSDGMGENERAGLDALLDKLRIDALVADDGAFTASFGAASLYYAEDTGLLVYLPDKALSRGADNPGAMEAILTAQGEPGKWYRPTVSGVPINSGFFSRQRPALIRLLGDALGHDLSDMKGEGMAALMSPDAGGFGQAFEYLLEDLALIAQRVETSLGALLPSAKMESLTAGLSGGDHLSLSSSTLAMALWDAQKALYDQINQFLGRQAPAAYAPSGNTAQPQQGSLRDQALPEIFKGLHFSDLFAQVYRGISGDLRRTILNSRMYDMLGRPVSLPWFSLDASPARVTLSVDDTFFMTADNKSTGHDSILWTGQVFVSGSQPVAFELKADSQSAVLSMNSQEGGLTATLSYSLPDWSQERALFTFNASVYSLSSDGALSDIQHINGTLYIDEDTINLQGSDGISSFSALLCYDEAGFTADIASVYRGRMNGPAYHAQADWQNGFSARFTQTAPNGAVSGVNAWINPRDSAVSFGFGTIDTYGARSLNRAILQGSFTQKDGSDQLILDMDGTLVDLKWMRLGDNHWRAVTSLSQAEQNILHAAVDVEASAGSALIRPGEYEDVDLMKLLNAPAD